MAVYAESGQRAQELPKRRHVGPCNLLEREKTHNHTVTLKCVAGNMKLIFFLVFSRAVFAPSCLSHTAITKR